MSNFIQKNNTGTLFLNERKTETKHPDYTGKAVINNKPYWVSLWIKVGKSGKKFISISIQEPFKKQERPETPQETFDEGYGEPQQDDFNKQIDKFQKEHKTTDEDNDVQVPF